MFAREADVCYSGSSMFGKKRKLSDSRLFFFFKRRSSKIIKSLPKKIKGFKSDDDDDAMRFSKQASSRGGEKPLRAAQEVDKKKNLLCSAFI